MTWKKPQRCQSLNGRADAYPMAKGIQCELAGGQGCGHSGR